MNNATTLRALTDSIVREHTAFGTADEMCAFRRKARAHFGTRPAHHAGMIADRLKMSAARAIAREEGRAL